MIAMKESFIYRTDAFILCSILFSLMLLSIFLGFKFGRVRYSQDEESAGNNTIVSALFGLLAFLLAVTFGMSGSRFDSRRDAIINESNAIGTAVLRADLYPDSLRATLRKNFKSYLNARIDYYEAGRDRGKMDEANIRADAQEKNLWQTAMGHARTSPDFLKTQPMIPALNDMFDNATICNTREKARVPDPMVILLMTLSIASAFYAGYISVGKGKLDWFIIVGFCLLTSLVIYITLDLDRPRRGLINLDATHQTMLDVLKLL
jgi:hypothetical protein